MTTEDLQGQVARSAAVERELREEIGKLREELAEAKHRLAEIEDIDICRLQLPDGRVPGGTVECARMWHAEAQRFWKERDAATARAAAAERERDDLIRQRDYEWDRRKKAQAARTAAESALAEARGALRRARKATLSACDNCHARQGSACVCGGQAYRAREIIDAALARAGEQETRQTAQQAGEAGGTAAPCNPRSTRSPATATGSELRQLSSQPAPEGDRCPWSGYTDNNRFGSCVLPKGHSGPHETEPAPAPEGIPPIDHDFQANTWAAVDACDKRVSDDPDGQNSRQCGRPRREHREPEGGK